MRNKEIPAFELFEGNLHDCITGCIADCSKAQPRVWAKRASRQRLFKAVAGYLKAYFCLTGNHWPKDIQRAGRMARVPYF